MEAKSMSHDLKQVCDHVRQRSQVRTNETCQYLKTLEAFLQNKADFNLFSKTECCNSEDEDLPISKILKRRSYIQASIGSIPDFSKSIWEELKPSINSHFIRGFIEVIRQELNQLINQKEEIELAVTANLVAMLPFQNGQSEQLCPLQPKFQKPILLRLDFTLIRFQIKNYPSLKDIVDSLFHLSFRVSSIRRHWFSVYSLYQMIKDHYYLLDYNKNSQISITELIEEVNKSSLFKIQKEKPIYLASKRENIIRSPCSSQSDLLKNANLIIIHTQWEEDHQRFGTGFIYRKNQIITATQNISLIINGLKRVSVKICPNSNATPLEWIEINPKKIRTLSKNRGISFIFLPESQNLLRGDIRSTYIDCTERLPEEVDKIYIYGFRFAKNQKDLQFSEKMEQIKVDKDEGFDVFYKIRSKISIGSLVFFKEQGVINIFGFYNQKNPGLLDFTHITNQFSSDINKVLNFQEHGQNQPQACLRDIDRRLIVQDTRKLPYSAIGLILARPKILDCNKKEIFYPKITSPMQGSGTLIDSNIILTCAHNLMTVSEEYDADNRTIINRYYFNAKKVRFYPGFSYRLDKQQLKRIMESDQYHYIDVELKDIYINNKYHQNYLRDNNNHLSSDLAIMHIKNNPQLPHLHYEQKHEQQVKFWSDHPINICGFPGQYVGQMMQMQGLGIVNRDQIKRYTLGNDKIDNMLYYLIDTSSGNSGSGVFYFDKEQNKYKVVAVHTQALSQHEENGIKHLINFGPLLAKENWLFVDKIIMKLKNSADNNIQVDTDNNLQHLSESFSK